MKIVTLDKLIWRLIFGGMMLFSLGLFMQRDDGVLGWVLTVGGVVATVAGVVLVFVRARRQEPGDAGS